MSIVNQSISGIIHIIIGKVEFPVPIPLAHVMKHAIGCIQDAVTLRRMSTIGILLYIYTSVKLTDVIIVGNIFFIDNGVSGIIG